jgi:hypothetical protein
VRIPDGQARELIEIEVTEADIKAGVPADSERCPIARAIARTLGIVSVSVDDGISLIDGWGYRTPPKATTFIHRFDDGHSVKPAHFTFQLAESEEEEWD